MQRGRRHHHGPGQRGPLPAAGRRGARGRPDLRQVPRRQRDQRRRRRRPARAPHSGDHPHRRRPVRPVRAHRAAAARRRTTFVTAVPDLPTPVVFCEIFPRTTSRSTSTACPRRRTWRSGPTSWTSTRSARRRCSGPPSPAYPRSPAARPPSRPGARGGRADHRARSRLPADVLAFAREASAEVDRALEHVTVAVGNLDECEIAVGEREPDGAAQALLERGVDWPSSSRGPRACSPGRATKGWRCRRCRSRWSTGWAPATPSAARCATDCSRAGSWSACCGSPTPPAPSSPPGWPAPAMPTTAEVDALLAGALRAPCVSVPGTVRDARAHRPGHRRGRGAPRAAAAARRRRPADDRRRGPPGAQRLRVRDRPLAMADRGELLARLCSRWSGPASTACSAPRTSSRTCCCSAPWTARSSSAR